MREDVFFPSNGKGKIHVCRWTPDREVKGVVQIVHGIAEYAQRYEAFAMHLNSLGIFVVASDHMGHGSSDGIPGYFHGGWFTAVEDVMTVMRNVSAEYPGVPYVLFGHSMGSFMARTVLAKYPDSPLSACVICGTAWQGRVVTEVAKIMANLSCKRYGEDKPAEKLQKLMFASYNNRIEHPEGPNDWLSRDRDMVKAYTDDPLCGFTVTNGLLRDMALGIQYIHRRDNLARMKKELPVLFVAGGDDPVGGYGSGVKKAAEEFRKAGMQDVSLKLFPLCRHEILNEINREEIFSWLGNWIEHKI